MHACCYISTVLILLPNWNPTEHFVVFNDFVLWKAASIAVH